MAGRGLAGRGEARQGFVFLIAARHGQARQGLVGHGRVRRGRARQGYFDDC
jgi:hypothetical protein